MVASARAASKPSAAKKARIAEAQAEVVAQGVESITSGAFDTELNFIMQNLCDDVPFACMVASLLRNGSLKQLLLMKSSPAPPEEGDRTPRKERVRQAMRNVKHMRPNEAEAVLRVVAPHLMTKELAATYENATAAMPNTIDVFCFAMNLSKEANFPHKDYPQIAFWDSMNDLFRARYELSGKRLDMLKTLLDFTGYWTLNQGVVACTLFLGKVFSVPSYSPDVDVHIETPCDLKATVTIPAKRLSVNLYEAFMDLECEFLGDDSDSWKWPGVAPQESASTTSSATAASSDAATPVGKKARSRAADSCASPNDVLAQAIRGKLKGSGDAKAAPPSVS